MREAVIVSAVRTPTGKFLGALKGFTAPQLGASKLSAGSLKSHFGDKVGLACWNDIQPKVADSEGASRLNERLQAIWPRLKSEINLVRRPSAEIEKALAKIDAPRRYPAIGFVDASLVAIAERLQIEAIATTDRRHFESIRPKHTRTFRLLP